MRLLSASSILAYLRNASQEKGEDILLEKIKSICKAKGISLRQLEQDAEIAPNTIARWDENKPSYDKVMRVADALDVTMDELVRGDVDDDKHPI